MNRRSIFKLFAGAVMASAMEVCGLKSPKVDVLAQVNPMYAAAEFEDVFFFHPHVVKKVGATLIESRAMSKRYNLEGGIWKEVPYYNT